VSVAGHVAAGETAIETVMGLERRDLPGQSAKYLRRDMVKSQAPRRSAVGSYRHWERAKVINTFGG